jgi:hypothetical protein
MVQRVITKYRRDSGQVDITTEGHTCRESGILS